MRLAHELVAAENWNETVQMSSGEEAGSKLRAIMPRDILSPFASTACMSHLVWCQGWMKPSMKQGSWKARGCERSSCHSCSFFKPTSWRHDGNCTIIVAVLQETTYFWQIPAFWDLKPHRCVSCLNLAFCCRSAMMAQRPKSRCEPWATKAMLPSGAA